MFSTLLGVWADSQDISKVGGSVTVVATAGATVLPYALFFAMLYFGGILAAWGFKRARYYFNEGPKVDKLRALAPKLGTAKAQIIRHYRNRESSPEGEVLADASALMAKFSEVFDPLRELGVPVGYATPYLNESDRGMRFTLAWLSALEQRARQGNLKGARSPYLVNHCWDLANGKQEPRNG